MRSSELGSVFKGFFQQQQTKIIGCIHHHNFSIYFLMLMPDAGSITLL